MHGPALCVPAPFTSHNFCPGRWDNKRHVLTLAGRAWPFRLASRRWYPSAVTLPNGLVLLMGGVTHRCVGCGYAAGVVVVVEA
jgi:hypothetical protein